VSRSQDPPEKDRFPAYPRPRGARRVNGKIAVLGLGNVLVGDDGAGPVVVRTLAAQWRFTPGVAVEDLGTPGLDLVPHVSGCERVVFVDTVRTGSPAGSVVLLDRERLLAAPPPVRVSPHDPGLAEVLLTLRFEGGEPRDVRLVGIEPRSLATGVGLSPEVRRAVPRACRRICDVLRGWGVVAERRDPPEDPDLWWLADAGKGEER